MKISKILTLFVLVSSSLAGATEYRCAENTRDALAKNRLQYAVSVTLLREITDPRVVGGADMAHAVRVQILARNPKIRDARWKQARNTFESVAQSADVLFVIDARRRHGFHFRMYMDEEDQTSVQLAGVNGSIGMNCTYRP